MASLQSKRTVKLPDDDVNWFRREYPDASLSWILTKLLQNFRGLHNADDSPRARLKDAADITLDSEF